jgi:hypothetical protein
VDGKEPDARADIYAIGIILWEMLCGRRLFVAKTDMETVELVRKGEVPKSTALRADVDEDLDKILQRALAKNVKRRFQTCRELEQDLAGYLAKKGVRATSADLVAFLREMLDAQPAPEQLDVATLLTNEMHELARVGRLDLNIGQAPLRPTDLRAPSRSKLDIGALLDRVHADELDALAPAEGWAERLEPAHAMSGQFRAATAPAKTAARPKWLLPVVALGALAILAALAVLAWQATRR